MAEINNTTAAKWTGDGTDLLTTVENLTPGQEHACWSQVLASFVWNQYCVPVLD